MWRSNNITKYSTGQRGNQKTNLKIKEKYVQTIEMENNVPKLIDCTKSSSRRGK